MRTARSTLTLAGTAALAGLAVLLLLLTLVLVPLVRAGEPESITGRDELVIGVDDDLPGLSARTAGGEREGFEIDVATYVAGRLGVAPADVTFRRLASADPAGALRAGTLDMVVATVPVTAELKERMTFAGPYYLAHQDVLVRQDDPSIRGIGDLAGKRLCRVAGSGSWRELTEGPAPDGREVPARSYLECAEELAAGRLDAVSTDDLVLAGLAGAVPGTTVLNAPFTDVKYGIGLREGDREGCRAVNRILTGMYQSGAATTMLNEWFATSGLELPTTVPQLEGCP